jgi:magnesium-transporting ATPase (P-type)
VAGALTAEQPTQWAGLSAAEAARRLSHDGPNEIPTPRGPSPLRLLIGQFVHFFALLLWAAAVLALLAGMPELSVAIVLVIVLNGGFAFAQEYRADRAAQRLVAMLPVTATVRRDGKRLVVPARELVLGDRVLLLSGDRISADLVLTQSSAAAVDESMLTGESVTRRPDVGDRVLAGTYLVEGSAQADVVATGRATRLAAIAGATQNAERPVSPLTKELHRVVRAVAVISVGVGIAFFFVALLLGISLHDGLILSVGVTVALVPEGLLPTVTLSLARAAQRMAKRNALVRRLEAVETLGATTFICSDKTGTLTRNEMTVVSVWTPSGSGTLSGSGYAPTAEMHIPPAARRAVELLADSAVRCSGGRAVQSSDGSWTAQGDPTEVALHVLALRLGRDVDAAERAAPRTWRIPFDPRRRRESAVAGGVLHVKGAPDSVLPRCTDPALVAAATHAADGYYARGLRVLAVARRPAPDQDQLRDPGAAESDLELLGVVALQDPPRDGIRDAIARCRTAGVQLALVTGDHPATARAIAAEVGLLQPGARVLVGADLPGDDAELGELVDVDGTVIARVTPEDKLRIAHALQERGHVVAMTGDGVNDGPALREADIGVAMGRSGTDVAREAADLVLLDDAFPTIVAAVELGRATTTNIRRFLTYHLTDNVAELTPFAVFALSGGAIPLALTVLMVLALDIGTDLLPALALGAEPPDEEALASRPNQQRLIDGRLLRRVFGVLGPAEAVVEMAAFLIVLLAGGWRWGEPAGGSLLLTASGTAFAAVVLGQLANALACRSEVLPVWRQSLTGNPMLLGALGFELLALVAFVGIPPVADLLDLQSPSLLGWALAALAAPSVVAVDALHKRLQRPVTTRG